MVGLILVLYKLKEKRKRITKVSVDKGVIVEDKDVYSENAASHNAKKINIHSEQIDVEIWIDKHYYNRTLFGSDDGSKREGIDYKSIEPLIVKSFKHLFYYSLKHSKFLFINHPPQKSRNIRVLLKDYLDVDEFLNVVLEFHFIDLHTIEVTIITALICDHFNLSDRQYGIEFEGNHSTLVQLITNSIEVIDDYNV